MLRASAVSLKSCHRDAGLTHSLTSMILAALWLVLGAGEAGGAIIAEEGEGPPRLELPTTAAGDVLKPLPELLPEGAMARYPGASGEAFFVRLEPSPGSKPEPSEFAETVLDPVLRALGFSAGAAGLDQPEAAVPGPDVNRAEMLLDLAAQEDKPEEIDAYLLEALAVDSAERDPWADAALEAAFGLDTETAIAHLESPRWLLVYRQMVDGVPIEGSGAFVSYRQGWGVDSISGALFEQWSVVNESVLQELSEEQAALALAQLDAVPPLELAAIVDTPAHLLVPYGTEDGIATLRHVYRAQVHVRWGEIDGLATLVVDAENGQPLAFRPTFDGAVSARGSVFRRAPDTATRTADFTVDPAVAGDFKLELFPHIRRPDRDNDGVYINELTIPEIGNGSSPSFANFDQAPYNDPTSIECNFPGNNRPFDEINLFQGLHRNRQTALAYGIWQPFPFIPWQPRFGLDNSGQPICNAWSSMLFYACQGFFKPNCPNHVGSFLAHYHDRTVISHEVAHHSVHRLSDTRPGNWCGPGVCPMPRNWDEFHDLADFWADHLENTNCTGGWTAKNYLGMANDSLNCNPLSHEGSLLPRLHEVVVPFDPVDPTDHFPEHFQLAGGGYAHGQVAAAALWQVRLGMRSRNKVGGHSLFWRYFIRALRFTGFYTPSAPTNSHRGLSEQLYELEVQMMQEWTWNAQVGSTSNKLQSGFARAGLFLIPPDCLDSNPLSTDAHFCPGGTNGGAAVIDIDDNDPADDLIVDGVTHRETDYLEIGGAVPSFDVWTGPRWRLTGDDALPVSPPALCNDRYRVWVSTDPQFTPAQTINSGWITVDTDVTTSFPPDCYGRWTPFPFVWNFLVASKPPGTKIYYRVETAFSNLGSNLMNSDEPGLGLWQPPSPYAVLTTDGRFARFKKALGISGPGGPGGGTQ